MPVPSYLLTNYTGTSDPAGDILTLIEARLTSAGWVYIEEASFTQASTARVQRTWKCPAALNASGVDFYVGLIKNAVPGVYLAVRSFEGYTVASPSTMQRPTIAASVGLAINTLPSSVIWAALDYGNGTWVATSQTSSAAAASSSNGIDWTARTLPASGNWRGVAYGNVGGTTPTFVATMSGTIAATSPDGATWTQRVMPVSASWTSVAFGNNIFVAVASTVAASSPTGVTWTQRTIGTTTWTSVAFGNGSFVAVGATTFGTYSTDGITWTPTTLPISASWTSVAYGNVGGTTPTFVAVANSQVITSTDNGVTWTPRVIGALAWTSVKYGNGVFVVVGPSAQATTSPDGVTWTPVGTYSQFPSGSASAIGFGNGTFIVLLQAASTNHFLSHDGVYWTSSQIYPGGIAGTKDWALTGGTTPLMAELAASSPPSSALTSTTNYDVAVLASRSYLVVTVALNGTTGFVLQWMVGLYSPSYADSQVTYPPLVQLDLLSPGIQNGNGVSRFLRSSGSPQTNIIAGAESLVMGQVSGVLEPYTQSIRASRVVVVGTPTAGFVSGTAFNGWLHDAVAAYGTIRVGDTITVGAVQYTCMGSAAAGAGTLIAAVTQIKYFFNTTAGT